MRLHMPRFHKDVFDENFKLVRELETFAAKKGCTTAQLALAWLLAQEEFIIPIPGATTKARVQENNAACAIELSESELKSLRDTINAISIQGARYPAAHSSLLEG
jgi:aryl-alcohol dehydrogenase-like predicted oxidoreductase